MSPEARRDVPAAGMSRRTFAIGAVGAAAMVGLGAVKVAGADPIVRPPGAQDEDAFIASCIHCERCREVYEAMGLHDDGTPYVIEDACNGCGACEHACISLSSGSLATGATDRAIVVVPESEVHHG